MCLARVFTDREMEEWLADKPEVIEVWKAVEIEREKYRPIYDYDCHRYSFPHSKAKREIIGKNGVRYWAGYHFFSSKSDGECLAEHEQGLTCNPIACIKCLIKKDWITAIGKSGWVSCSSPSLVASQAVFPHYPETEARWEDLPKEEIIELAAAENIADPNKSLM